MNQYEEILTEIKADILRLETLHAGLEKWMRRPDEPVDQRRLPPAATPIVRRSVNLWPAKEPKGEKTPEGQAGVVRKNDPAIIEKGRNLPEPFGAREMMVALGADKIKTGSNVVDNWARRGWLVRVGVGRYKRGKTFGKVGASPPAARAAVALDKAAPAPVAAAPAGADKLRSELANALKQRDHARANGRDALVEMFQETVDKLEEQLERVTGTT